MRRFGIIALIAFVLTACGDNGEKKATLRLQAAESALAQGDYSEAKLQLDSIKILFPKAFNARQQGISLMQKVELQEQEKSVAYLDSMLKVKQLEVDGKKKMFVLEKNAEYQDVGNYFYPSQTSGKNFHRTYLCAQVSELGDFSLTSVYCGGSFIHHRAIRVSVADGSFAQTPASNSVYESTDSGLRTEKVDYRIGSDGGVANFISLNKDQNIKLEYIGIRKYVVNISPLDRKAIFEVYNLGQIFAGITQIKKELKEANLKIRFVKKKMEQASLNQ